MFKLIRSTIKLGFFFVLSAVLVCVGLFALHHFADQEGKQKIEALALDGIDFLRESKAIPPEFIDVLDLCYDNIPLSAGNVVYVKFIENTSPFPGGFPKSESNYSVYKRIGYTVAYDEEKRNPAWVCYQLFVPKTDDAGNRPTNFFVDLATRARVEPQDYKNSGYDRGHMAPNYGISVCYGPKAQSETFLMSNIVPQRQELNRQMWKDLEMREIKRYTKRFETVWVITGPIYSQLAAPRFNKIAVPESFFKIIIDEYNGGYRAVALVISQKPGTESLRHFLTSIDYIEERTGLDFFPNWTPVNQEKLEAKAESRVW